MGITIYDIIEQETGQDPDNLAHIDDGVYDLTGVEYICISYGLGRALPSAGQIDAEMESTINWYRKRDAAEDQIRLVRERYEEKKLLESKVRAFVSRHKDTVCIGAAYDVSGHFLLSRKPTKFAGRQYGDGFEGHGTAVVLDGLPSAIMILGQID